MRDRPWAVRHEREIAVCLLILAAAVRFIALTEYPAGLNQDEASTGYEAWALLHYGLDRAGDSWPVLLTSWGSGQNILYSWLSMPFIALFGLNVFSLRLTAAVCGVAACAVMWRLARRCGGVGCGLCALLLLAVNPWHIMASRWALESNLMPLFLLAGVLCTVRSRKDVRWLMGAAACFALALYAYGTAFFFLPVFLLVYVLWNRSLLREKWFWLAAGLFALLALPIGLCQLINMTGLPEMTFLGITLPKLTAPRQAAVSVFGSGLAGIADNARTFGKLLITQSDGLRYNALPGSGLYYFFGLPLAAAGLVRSLLERKARSDEQPVRLALIVSLVCACLITVNVNRVNMVWLPLLYFQGVGLEWLLSRIGRWGALPLAAVAVCFALFMADYGREPPAFASLDGLNDALACAEESAEGTVYVTDKLPMPYIYVLFTRRTPPAEFADTVVYSNPGGPFQNAVSFGRYRFDGGAGEDPEGCYVLTRREFRQWADQMTCLGEFGDYVVCAAPRETGAAAAFRSPV